MRSLCLTMLGVGLMATATWGEGTITMVGRATVSAMPDGAKVDLYGWAINLDLAAGKAQARAQLDAAVRATRDLQLPGLRLEPKPQFELSSITRNETTMPRLVYILQGRLAQWITSDEATQLSLKVQEATAKNTNDQGSHVCFMPTGDRTPVWQEAVAKATRQAMDDAKAVAGRLGLRIRGYRHIGVFPEGDKPPSDASALSPLYTNSMIGKPAGERLIGSQSGSNPSWPVTLEATVYVTAVY